MEDNHLPENLLDENEFLGSIERRRDLLPIWIKVFTWLFMIVGVMVPIVVILDLFGYNSELALYGLESTQLLSLFGLIITGLFLLKGVTAFGLWFEKKWAVNLAIIDAGVGILVCVINMIFLPLFISGWGMQIRLEIAILIPYLVTMMRINYDWPGRIEMKGKNPFRIKS